MTYTTYQCINCSNPVTTTRTKKPRVSLCNDCIRAEEELTAMLKKGITLQYDDGTSETISIPKQGDAR
jgi:NAD-dependent SIR2 family protein deacetylase